MPVGYDYTPNWDLRPQLPGDLALGSYVVVLAAQFTDASDQSRAGDTTRLSAQVG
jgi:hypothetical protein